MHRARKRFGQHFLKSPDVIDQIVTAIAPEKDQTLVEIGPGQAAITAPIAEQAGTLHAIEFDRDLVVALRNRFQNSGNVTVHEADALQFDFASLGSDLRIVGNLPYNISTPLLFHLLDFRDSIRDLHFMLQKEVVDRMSAVPGTKDFGRLTVMLGCQMEVVPLFDVPPDAFEPAPRVVSSVVGMRPLPTAEIAIDDPVLLAELVKAAFSRRRKTLRNALRERVSDEQFSDAGIDSGRRPEEIAVAGWVALANRVAAVK